jgi:hypothetical protein
MKTAMIAGSVTLLFLGINSLMGNKRVTGFDSVILYFVLATWVNGLKK